VRSLKTKFKKAGRQRFHIFYYIFYSFVEFASGINPPTKEWSYFGWILSKMSRVILACLILWCQLRANVEDVAKGGNANVELKSQ